MPLMSFNQQRNKESINELRQQSARISSHEKPDLMEDHPTETEKEVDAPRESYSSSLLRDEFIINMQKFAMGIKRTVLQIEGEVRLDIPDLFLSDKLEENLRNEDLRHLVVESCNKWSKLISDALDALQKKTPQGNGPLAEIDYWRERNAGLSALSEQLKVPRVVQILELYTHFENSNSFDYLKQDLNKFYVEAKDNVRFLSTLERHFKNVTHGASFQSVIDTLPSMMNALRMVWIISRHYNRDERMVPLMERIAWELVERVSRVIIVRTLFEWVF